MKLSDYNDRTPREILKDVNEAWDRIKDIQRQNDEQENRLLKFGNMLKWRIAQLALILLLEVANLVLQHFHWIIR